MNEKITQYIPSPAEQRKAEAKLTDRDRELSEMREDTLFEGRRQGAQKTENENTTMQYDGIDFDKIEKNKKFLIAGETIFDKTIGKKEINITCSWDDQKKMYALRINHFGTTRISISETRDLFEAFKTIKEFSEDNSDPTKIRQKLVAIGNALKE